MSGKRDSSLLTIGVFLIILVISILLYTPMGLYEWPFIPPVILALIGCWLMVLAGMRRSNPQKYERSPFSTFAMGAVLIAVGGAWFIASINWLYSVALVLLVFGVLAIFAAFGKK